MENDEKDNEEENNDVDKEFGEQESITRLYQGAKLTSTKNVLVADWLKVSSERTAVTRKCEDLQRDKTLKQSATRKPCFHLRSISS